MTIRMARTCPHFDIRTGDALAVLRTLPEGSVQTCITSPPYWGLRDYGVTGQLGLEPTPEAYVVRLVEIFAEVRRVLRADGTLWVNLGDSYASGGKGGGGSFMAERRDAAWQKRSALNGWRSRPAGLKDKDLVGIPWRVAFALQADGWYLRSDIIWHKPNPMPESVTDRPTKAHEYLFLLAKSERYYYDAEAIAETATNGERFHGDYGKPGCVRDINRRNGRQDTANITETRNARSVWTLSTQANPEAHFATFPIELPERCILAATRPGDLVLDPFSGAGTTGLACLRQGRRYLGIELNPAYVSIAHERAEKYYPLLAQEQECSA